MADRKALHPPEMARRMALAVGAVLLAGVIAHGGTLWNGFVYDDHRLIERSRLIRGIGNAPEILRTKLWDAGELSVEYYRPLTALSFAANYSLGGLDPFGYHLVNLLLHLTSAVLLFLVVRRVAGDLLVAAASGLVFAAHPVGTEAVAWVSCRGDLLALVFILAAVLLHVGPVHPPGRLGRALLAAGAWACALLAAFSKEHALVLVGLLVAADCSTRPRRNARNLLRYVPFILVAAIFLLARWEVTGQLMTTADPADMDLAMRGPRSFAQKLLDGVLVMRTYILLYLWPASLSIDNTVNFSTPISSPLDGRFIASALVVLAASACAILAAIRSRPARLGVIWFLAAYSIISGVVFAPSTHLVAERYLYIPSAGLAALAGAGLVGLTTAVVIRSAKSRPARTAAASGGGAAGTDQRLAARGMRISAAVVAVVAALLAARSGARATEWRADRELFTAALRDSPDSPVSLFNLGTDYSRSGDFDRAELLLARASELYPGYYKARMNYAQLLRLRGKVREAEEILVSLAERWPGSGATFLALGELHLAERRVELAVGAYGKAVEIAPENGLARAGLARALVTAGRRTEASEQARKAASLAPEDPMVILQSAQALLDAGLREEASGLLMRAVELPATSAHLLNSLAEVCFRAGLMEQAAAALDRAEAAGPDLSITHYNRALLLRRREDLVGAERELRRALSLSPGDARARVRLAQILARSGRTDEALAEATAAVQADASFADARIARADIHIARQAYSEAEQDLRAALVLQPSSALAHYNLGLLLARSGRRAEALQHVATAAQLDPRKADYANALETLRRGGMSAAGR